MDAHGRSHGFPLPGGGPGRLSRTVRSAGAFRRTLLILLPVLLLACPPVLHGCRGHGGEDRVILEVNGEPVTLGAFEEELAFQKGFREILPPGKPKAEAGAAITEEALKKEILNRMLIPMALVRSRYKERIPALLSKAEEIKARITPDGSNFAALARQYSKDTNADRGGELGYLPRIGPPYPLARMAFETPEGTVAGPFLSLVGCHLLLVQEKKKGTVPAVDRVRAAHILLPYEEKNPAFLADLFEKALPAAKIAVKDPAFAAYVEVGRKTP